MWLTLVSSPSRVKVAQGPHRKPSCQHRLPGLAQDPPSEQTLCQAGPRQKSRPLSGQSQSLPAGLSCKISQDTNSKLPTPPRPSRGGNAHMGACGPPRGVHCRKGKKKDHAQTLSRGLRPAEKGADSTPWTTGPVIGHVSRSGCVSGQWGRHRGCAQMALSPTSQLHLKSLERGSQSERGPPPALPRDIRYRAGALAIWSLIGL